MAQLKLAPKKGTSRKERLDSHWMMTPTRPVARAMRVVFL